MNINDIIVNETWDQMLVSLEKNFHNTIENNSILIKYIQEDAKMAGYQTNNQTIKPGSSYDMQIKEYEKINEALAKILATKK